MGLIILLAITAIFIKVIVSPNFNLFPNWRLYSATSAGLSHTQKQILHKYCYYYQSLKPQYKREFEKRVAIFIKSKRFVPRQLNSVTEEMKVMISATAIQLTFGLPKIYLSHFSKILVYPNEYYSTINKRYHKGEVNPRFGLIVLSWDNFVTGFQHKDDGINLGLHELAHALHLENRITNSEFDFFDNEHWSTYEALGLHERQLMRDGASSFFRSYAATDEYEFFAVAIEAFFERSEAFKQQKPALYQSLAHLLKQDPLKVRA
jgi:Mlc titration factor MtfA (ptsG expression regulator)